MKRKINNFTLICVLILVFVFMIMLFVLCAYNDNKMKIKNIDGCVYELEDESWFIVDKENKKYIFQAVELGDYDYILENEEQLKKIIASYFTNKYNIKEDSAIEKVEQIFKDIK